MRKRAPESALVIRNVLALFRQAGTSHAFSRGTILVETPPPLTCIGLSLKSSNLARSWREPQYRVMIPREFLE